MSDRYLGKIGGTNGVRTVMKSLEQVGRAYRAFAPACDAFFGVVLEPGRRAAIQERAAAENPASQRQAWIARAA